MHVETLNYCSVLCAIIAHKTTSFTTSTTLTALNVVHSSVLQHICIYSSQLKQCKQQTNNVHKIEIASIDRRVSCQSELKRQSTVSLCIIEGYINVKLIAAILQHTYIHTFLNVIVPSIHKIDLLCITEIQIKTIN